MNNNQLLDSLNKDSSKIIETIPELTYVGNEVLRTKTTNVNLEEGVVIGKKLIDALLKYRSLTGLGVGLAAPQIGISANVFVTWLNETTKVHINPEIISSSEEKNTYKECCLSSGHLWCDVVRPKEITISYWNEQGEKISECATANLARLIQHEYDHLQGIVNLDKAIDGTIEYRFGNPKEQKLRG